ncbi:MAG: flagellar motor switch protein FliG [Hyphomicrobiales bacterium]|nr:flagellar motor switch protein FliG [Hyphomicrobiales bacterium]
MNLVAAPNVPGIDGVQRAASLLLSMDKEAAGRLLKYFDRDDLRAVLKAAERMASLGPSALEGVLAQFESEVDEGPGVVISQEKVEDLLAATLDPAEAAALGGNLAKRKTRDVWAELGMAAPKQIAQWLSTENAQAAAFVVSKLSPDLAAETLALVSVDLRGGILARMLRARPPEGLYIGLIERELMRFLETKEDDDKEAPARIGKIINKMDTADFEATLEELARQNPADAQRVKKHVFKFEDIVKLDAPARAALFDRTPTERTTLALFETEGDLREAVLSALSARGRRMVESELTSGVAPAQKDIATARRAIADLALQLAESGELVMPGEDLDPDES